WAQDATAMHTYAVNTAAAAPKLTTFTPAPQTTTPTAAAATPGPLTQLAKQIASNPTISGLATFVGDVTVYEDIPLGAFGPAQIELMFFTPAVVGAETAARGFAASLTTAGGPGAELASSVSPGIDPVPSTPLGASAPTSADCYRSEVSAGLGRATPVGGLSAPPAWGSAPQRIRLAAAVLPTTGVANLPEAGIAAPGGMLGGIPPVAGMVNAPSSGQRESGGQSNAEANPQTARATDAGGAVQHRSIRPCPPAGHEATASGREELRRLRQMLSDLATERDALERSADSLLRLAGLGPVSGRR
ncbi:PE/PPE C-terminal domain-containing protein, partial [Mycobacterium sp. THU-M104]|uniref:PE/PPE C-terminal domain-containing protein n=1 Tax=Mycobacterium sp. THU-M104 TaxID=3410515 RepID=UPI003B9AEC75